MRSTFKIFLLCLLPVCSMAQKDPTWGYVTPQQADSLKASLATQKNDTLKLAALRSLGFYYQDFITDSGLYFHEQQIALAKKLNMKLWLADGYSQAGYCYSALGNIMKSYDCHSETMKLAGDKKNESDDWRPWTFSNATNGHEARVAILGMNYVMMGNLWGKLGDVEKQRAYYQEAADLGKTINNGKLICQGYSALANFLSPDSAITYINIAMRAATSSGFKRLGPALFDLAKPYVTKQMWDSALYYASRSIPVNIEQNNLRALVGSYWGVSFLYARLKNKDSSLFYANKAYTTAKITGVPNAILQAYQSLSGAYQVNDLTDSALKYEKLSNKLNDSLKNARLKSLTDYQKYSFNEQLRLKKLDEEKTAYANRLKMLGLVVVLGGILLTTLILYRNNRQKQKANKVLEATLSDLRSTQTQLVHAEKMASLGELTAGIAHEIQNPLNFVNNFSEVNSELIAEMKEELNKGQIEEAKAIANDIDENEQKIIFHGKRADAIVKSMLQHSRSGSNKKEPADINALCDEYLRLSYHGLRAKDKSFNATLKTELDPSIGEVNIIVQDMGRVILNIINNAFYAVDEKRRSGAANYTPTVTVSTAKRNGMVEIRIQDNANGIPQKVVDKIFQPFFTTKPTGEGTGLGLSLSYDIVKAHGGEIKVETKAGEGTTFNILLPAQNFKEEM